VASFHYRAAGAAGLSRTGFLEASDLDDAAQRVRDMGLTPIRLEQRAVDRGIFRFHRKRAQASEVILFTRQLETMLDAGLPLLSALETLHEQTTDRHLKEAVNEVRARVERGSTLTEAMSGHPGCFSDLYLSLIHAGEEGGILTAMLDRIGELLEYQEETGQRIRAATFYPTIVLIELGIAFFVLVKFVLPRFASLFRNLGADLPLPTRVLIAVSDGVDRGWPVLLTLALFGGIGLSVWLKTDKGRRLRDSGLLAIPVLGEILRKIALARFARVLGAMVESGIPIVQSLTVARNVLGNRALQAEADRMREGLMAGEGLAEPLRGSRIMPPLLVKMLAVGEETGSIGPMLARIARSYDRDVDYAVKGLSQALEPLLLLVLGGAVLFTALAVLLPLWNLMGAFRH
jgi:type II secretory pathway component PulF